MYPLHNFSYEKIRVVGKGAFGNAVLYRRKDDGLMCIIKVFYSLNFFPCITDIDTGMSQGLKI